MSDSVSNKKVWDDWDNPVPDFDSAASSISESDVLTPIAKDMSASIPRVAIARSHSSLKSKGSNENSPLAYSTSKKDSPAEKLIRLIEMSNTVKTLKDVAKKAFMNQYIFFYEEQLLIRYLANNVTSDMLLTLVKDRVSKLISEYLVDNAPQKLKVSDPVLTQTMFAIEKLKTQTSQTPIDVQFLHLLTGDVMNHAASVILPAYEKTPKEHYPTPPKPSTPTRDDFTVDNIAQILEISLERDKFMMILAKQHCLENLFYFVRYKEAHAYSLNATSPIEKQTLKKMIKLIGKDFIAADSLYELNIPSKVRNDFETQMKEANITISVLEPTLKEVLSMLLLNTYPLIHKLEYSIACINNMEQKLGDLPLSSASQSISRFGTTISKDNSSLNESISSLGSRESSNASSSGPSILGRGKSRQESPAQQISKILESNTKSLVLREICDKYIIIHYINLYDKLILVKDLAANGNNSFIVDLMRQTLKDIEKTYLMEGAPLRLLMFSPALVRDLAEGCKKFHAENPVGEINTSFLSPVIQETLDIIANALLAKFKLKKSSSAAKTSSLTASPANVNKIDETNFDNVKQVLDSPVQCEKMLMILAKQHCMENYFYYLQQKEVYAYAATATSPIEKQTLKKMIKNVGRDFIVSGAPYELNLSSKVKGDFDESVKSGNIILSLLEPVTKEVLEMLIRNTYPLYLKLKC